MSGKSQEAHNRPRKHAMSLITRMQIRNNQIKDTTAALAARLRKLKKEQKK